MGTEQETKIKRIPLVFDVDDVILNSCKAIVDILNNTYELAPKASEENNRDWNFTHLKRLVKEQKGIDLYDYHFLKLFETIDFWDTVEIKKEFLNLLTNQEIRRNFHIIIASTGTEENLKMKEKFLYSHLNMKDIYFLKLPFDLQQPKYDKKGINNFIDLQKGIQIDDKYECLDTNAKLKILLKNNKDTKYNYVSEIREDLYIINDLAELEELLMFIANSDNEFFLDLETI